MKTQKALMSLQQYRASALKGDHLQSAEGQLSPIETIPNHETSQDKIMTFADSEGLKR